MAPTTLALLSHQAALNVCNTPACHDLSKTLLASVNLNADPCSDFFQFTCGSWLESDPVKSNTERSSIAAQTSENSLKVIQSLLNSTFEDVSKLIETHDSDYHTKDEVSIDKKNFELAQRYNNICIDTKSIAELGVTPIFPYIAQIENDLLPIQKEIDPKKLAMALVETTLLEIPSILDITAVRDAKNHDFLLVSIKPSVLDSLVDYSSIVSLNSYKERLVSLLTTVIGGPSSSDSTYGQLIIQESRNSNFTFWSSSKIDLAVSNFINFEMQLAQVDSNEVPIFYATVELLNNNSTYISWDTFLSTMVAPEEVNPDLLIAFNNEHLSYLDTVLSKTPMKTLQEYWVIQAVKSNRYLNTHPTIVEELDPLNNTEHYYEDYFRAPTSRSPVLQTREEFCGNKTGVQFKDIIGRLFALTTFGATKEKKETEDLVDHLQSVWVNDMLPNVDWIGDKTKKVVIDKVKNITKKVAYSTMSPDWRSPADLEEYYKDLSAEGNYFQASHSFNRWKNYKLWNGINHKVDTEEWTGESYPNLFNAFYSSSLNFIEILIGALQKPFYSPHYPQYMNYGGLGFIVGHEFTHSLDSKGRFYDKEGYHAELFTEADSKTYDEKSQCFVEQFNKFALTGPNDERIPLNGTNILGENIADSGGLRIAYNAYIDMIKKRGSPEPTIPGFEKYTPEQLFFISRGQFTCATTKKEEAQILINTDNHAPSYYRNIGALQNSVEFAKAFNCPVGSPMNPKKKCSVW